MITVGGFNSSIDKTMEMTELRSGAVNRASSVRAYAGGKGLHVARAIGTLASQYALPIGFGLLTVDTIEQAVARAGGTVGNKGHEAAEAALLTADVLRRASHDA